MAAITLPSAPAARAGMPELLRFGGDLKPPLGGPVQRIVRLGTRFALTLDYPPMLKASFDALMAALIRADTEGTTVLTDFVQQPSTLTFGTPLVNGASQVGATLAADGFTSGLAIPAGTLFSFTASGRNYLHMVHTAVTATGGAATLAIGPMLRASPADNAALQFAAPKIEGFVEAIRWRHAEDKTYALSVTIAEAE